jgi:ribulose-5-phosphate 4-epimerase/fuculose-1-phosphate aldolase
MSASTPTVATKQQANSSADEWETRVQLAACYRIFDMLGWTEMIFNYISLRVPGPDGHFLINPFGPWYREVTASNLVKVDIEGNPADSSRCAISLTGKPCPPNSPQQ